VVRRGTGPGDKTKNKQTRTGIRQQKNKEEEKKENDPGGGRVVNAPFHMTKTNLKGWQRPAVFEKRAKGEKRSPMCFYV